MKKIYKILHTYYINNFHNINYLTSFNYYCAIYNFTLDRYRNKNTLFFFTSYMHIYSFTISNTKKEVVKVRLSHNYLPTHFKWDNYLIFIFSHNQVFKCLRL